MLPIVSQKKTTSLPKLHTIKQKLLVKQPPSIAIKIDRLKKKKEI